MSVELIVRPGKVIIPGDFVSKTSEHPPNSIALDGYVRAAPFTEETENGFYANYDHHHDVDRLATRSTAQQILMGIGAAGLVRGLTQGGEFHVTAHANDFDQDVSLAWYLLSHAPDVKAWLDRGRAGRLQALVDMAGNLDVTGGAYPYSPRLKLMKQIAWMFRPFTEMRMEGALSRDATQYREIIGQCCGRIGLHLVGRGDKVKLDTKFGVLGGGDTWTMFEELGPEGRIGAFRKGIDAYVIYKGSRQYEGNVRYDHTIGRLSRYIRFPVRRIVDGLNEREGLTGTDRWGCDGSGVMGGSPREAGSGYDPDTLNRVINEIITELKPRPISDRIKS